MSKSRAKGTKAETAIVNYLRANGFPHAERRALAGSADKGDIAGVPGVVIEAKDCVRAELAAWADEAAQEAVNAGAPVGAVWFKRRGTTDPGRWFVLLDGATFCEVIR
jgi:hypothetical protein